MRDVQVLDERGYTSFWIEGQAIAAALTPSETGNAPGVMASPSPVPDDDEYATAGCHGESANRSRGHRDLRRVQAGQIAGCDDRPHWPQDIYRYNHFISFR